MVKKLLNLLGTTFNKDENSNNYKLLNSALSEFDNLEQVLSDIKNAHFVDYATGQSLDYIASLFSIRREKNETDEYFRARIKVVFSKLADMATVQDIKEIVAAALKTKTNRVRIKEKYNEPAYFEVWVWLQDLNNAGLTIDEFQQLIKAIKPAGVRVQAYQRGTFTYRSIGEASDPTKGYNDLANSNPDAGTYAALL